MSDFIISLIRTYVPIVVGAVVAWLVSKGITIPPESVSGAVILLTAAFSGLYYIIVRTLEQKYPQAGWLLGKAKEVKYN